MAKYQIREATDTVHEWLSFRDVNELQIDALDKIGYALWRMIENPPEDERRVKMYMIGCLIAAYQVGKGSPIPDAFFGAVEALEMSDFNNPEAISAKITSLFEDTGW